MNRRGFVGILAGLVAAPGAALAAVEAKPAAAEPSGKVSGAQTGSSPRWPGMCPECEFLGTWQNPERGLADLWGCSGDVLGACLMARYGPDSDIRTWTIPRDTREEYRRSMWPPDIAEAYARWSKWHIREE